MAIVAAILSAIALVLPNFTCHCTDKADTIVNSLSELDAGKNQWVLDHPKEKSSNLTWNDLSPYFGRDFWNKPVADETYLINKIGEPASALVPKKTDWIPANTEVRLGPDRKVQIRSMTPGSDWTE